MPQTIFQEVIDIPSSPEPAPSRIPRSAPRPKGKSKQKGYSKPKAARPSPFPVIDLSADDDADDGAGSAVRLLAATAGASRSNGVPASTFSFSSKSSDIRNPFSNLSQSSAHDNGPRKPSPIPASAISLSSPQSVDVSVFLNEPPPDPKDLMLASVIEILPDVLPAHVNMLINQLIPTHGDGTANFVLQYLFDHPDYPKIDRDNKGKRKRDDGDVGDTPTKRGKVDYGSTSRAYPESATYSVVAEEQLFEDFPLVPRPYVRKVMSECKFFYAPSHLRLLEDANKVPLPYHAKRSAHYGKSKGKGRATFDATFEAEREWLAGRLAEEDTKADAKLAEQLNEEEYEATGDGLECGCCFGEYPFDKMVQCAEGHLFCSSCARRNAEEQLGARKADLLCMDQSSCPAHFPESEIARFLPEKTLALYHRIKQSRDIEKAGLAGLESCPYCDYCCVIENEEEKLFRCENEDCLVVSCRKCKKQDHLPKSCKEMEEDSKLDARHAVEEAMTNALMRKCPKCQYSFVKEMGCNKMTCPQCRTLSCYVCRKIINGYDHFNQAPPYDKVKDPTKCPLWDTNTEKSHADDVAAAAQRAKEEILQGRKEGDVQLDAKDIDVELPVAPPAPPGPGPGQPGYNGGPIPREYLMGQFAAPMFPVNYRNYMPVPHVHGLPNAGARHFVPVPPPIPPPPPPPGAPRIPHAGVARMDDIHAMLGGMQARLAGDMNAMAERARADELRLEEARIRARPAKRAPAAPKQRWR